VRRAVGRVCGQGLRRPPSPAGLSFVPGETRVGVRGGSVPGGTSPMSTPGFWPG